jgi:hypothetical protein
MDAAPRRDGKASVWRRLLIAIAFVCLPLSADTVASAVSVAVGIPSYLLYSIGIASLMLLIMLLVIRPQLPERGEAGEGSRWKPGVAVWIRLGACLTATAVMFAAFLLARRFVVLPELARPDRPLVWLMILILPFYPLCLCLYGLTLLLAKALTQMFEWYHRFRAGV